MIICLGPTPAVQRVMRFDRLVIDAVNRSDDIAEGPAGKSVNVAKVVKSLGQTPIALGFVGGNRGQFLCAELDRLAVRHDFVSVTPPTRLCITVIDQAAGEHTELVEESSAVAGSAYEQLAEKLERALPNGKMLILSGSLTPGGPQDFYAKCIKSAHRHGVPVILDAQGGPLMAALPLRPSVVKPNRAELAATVGMQLHSDSDLQRAMRRLTEMGATAVVVTIGPDGAAAWDGKVCWRIAIPRVAAINPIGSGDAFTAGLACALVDGKDLADACRLGAACGVANALTLMAGEVRPEDVDRLIGQIRVDAI